MRLTETRLDRYPGKMVSRLAAELVSRYGYGAREILDPFCGSGAILAAGARMGLAVRGVDLNPYAVLLSSVKLEGFDPAAALHLWRSLRTAAERRDERLAISLRSKTYWFRSSVVDEYERLRSHLYAHGVASFPEGRAILLSLALSARICSFADQRSPKPFISSIARRQRQGYLIAPLDASEEILKGLSASYSRALTTDVKVQQCDLLEKGAVGKLGRPSHIITSPPYINAQDYFRNSKLELALLEGLLGFDLDSLGARFIGTERGVAKDLLRGEGADFRRSLCEELIGLEVENEGIARVVHGYFANITDVFRVLGDVIEPAGTLVIVCGDNLVVGRRIETWRILSNLAERLGFFLVDRYGDVIARRSLAPRRLGHRGLIKQEMVSVFRSRSGGLRSPA